METKRKNKILFLIFGLFAISIIIFIVSLFIEPSDPVLDEQEIPVFLGVGNVAGINLSEGILNFGVVIPSTSSMRNDVVITNNYAFPIVAHFNVEGEVDQFLNYSRVIPFYPGEEKNIHFNTIVFSNETKGDYLGTLTITYMRA